jgi:O-antigen ligase
VTLIDSIEKIKQLAWVIVLSQGYLALELNLTYYTTVFMSEEFSFAGLDNNGIAITMVTCMGVALFLALEAAGWWRKVIAAACALFMAHVVLFSMSRGGMLAMVITGAGTFLLIPKRPIHYAGLAVAVLIILRLAGPQVQEEFLSAFKPKDELDASAASRWGLTAACISLMQEYPLMGVGINRFGEHVEKFGYWRGKEAHNTWGSMGAELGIPGLGFLATFYLLGMYRLWWLARDKSGEYDPWFGTFARMILCSMTGFIVSATFVTVEGVETPYYIMAIGAGALKLHSNTLPLPRMLPYATLDARHLARETQLAGSAATAG